MGEKVREDPVPERATILIVMLSWLVAPSLLTAQEKPLAPTPPMGWNSWNKFGCHVSEDLIRQMADAMVKSGMKDAGYQYIVIDDCWQVERDSSANARCQKLPLRDQGAGRLRSLPRAQVWNLFRCRQYDVCQAPRQPGS